MTQGTQRVLVRKRNMKTSNYSAVGKVNGGPGCIGGSKWPLSWVEWWEGHCRTGDDSQGAFQILGADVTGVQGLPTHFIGSPPALPGLGQWPLGSPCPTLTAIEEPTGRLSCYTPSFLPTVCFWLLLFLGLSSLLSWHMSLWNTVN